MLTVRAIFFDILGNTKRTLSDGTNVDKIPRGYSIVNALDLSHSGWRTAGL